MASSSPVQIAFLIVGLLSIIGLIVFFIRHRSTFSGYQEFEMEIRSISRALHGEIFRDADDLVISGNYGILPTIIRFSNADNTPGLNITVQAPATFTMTVAPAAVTGLPGRVVGRTGDPQFDTRFTIRSEQPLDAKMFLSPQSIATIRKLACSTKTQLSVATGSVELSELVVPEPNPAHHIVEHLKQISALTQTLRAMPGADAIKIVPFKRERHLAARIAIAAGVAGAIITVFTATSSSRRPPVISVPKTPAGVLPVDAQLIRDVDKWRLASAADFDDLTLAWLRDNGVEPAGRIPAVFSAGERPGDAAYLLVKPDGMRRVVLLAQGLSRYDAEFSSVGGIALLPKDNIAKVDWMGGHPPGPVDGDGLVVIRDGTQPTSAIVLFLQSGRVVIGSPRKFDGVSLR